TVVDAVTIASDTLDYLLKHMGREWSEKDRPRNTLLPDSLPIHHEDLTSDDFPDEERRSTFLGLVGNLSDGEKRALLEEELSAIGRNMIVTPKEVDEFMKDMASLIAEGINASLHQKISVTQDTSYTRYLYNLVRTCTVFFVFDYTKNFFVLFFYFHAYSEVKSKDGVKFMRQSFWKYVQAFYKHVIALVIIILLLFTLIGFITTANTASKIQSKNFSAWLEEVDFSFFTLLYSMENHAFDLVYPLEQPDKFYLDGLLKMVTSI